MSVTNIICECILVGSCMSGVKIIAKSKPKNPEAWRSAFLIIAAAASLGASKYAGFTEVAPIHSTLSGIGSFLGVCCIALGANQSIGLFNLPELYGTVLYGVICVLQAVILFSNQTKHTAILKNFMPLILVVGTTVMAFAKILLSKVHGINKTKATNYLLGVFCLILGDTALKMFGEDFWIVPDYIQNVDVFHVLLALAMFLFGNTVSPRETVTRGKKKTQ
ncbi:7 TM domain-containing transmembrane protein [Acrasis kona]|uniref:7 TM domain-containing transmembrane protein n=1 Tax=Acrasis kona TaxID=1008807 RepID=A0AAW2ZJF6_9EUKA